MRIRSRFSGPLPRSLKKFMQRYEDLEVQIGRIEGELEKARMEMLKDVAMFDGLYEKNLEYFQELQIYIAAGEEKLKELREETIPPAAGTGRTEGRSHERPAGQRF